MRLSPIAYNNCVTEYYSMWQPFAQSLAVERYLRLLGNFQIKTGFH